jgi:4-hydroxy-2-oxoheptanedioate aldolase
MKLRPNRVKEKLADGEVAVSVVGFTHPDDIDTFGPIANATGIDAIWLEGEHAGVDPANLGNLTRACDLWGLTPIVRLNANSQGLIYRTLDCGAQGIAVPHVNNAAEAQNVVDGGKFPPIGKRGNYTSRQGHGVPNYMEVADTHSLLIVFIEDIIAYQNLDEILETEHIDVFFVAPGDFAASMGHAGIWDQVANIPEVAQTMEDTFRRIQAAGRIAGATCGKAGLERYLELGAKFFLTTTQEWLDDGAANFMSIVDGHSK